VFSGAFVTMPTYTYRCTACGYQFDQFQKFSDDPLTECPQCQGLIRKVLQPVGVVFKGSGWYINDSRKPESTSSASSSDKSEKSGSDAAPTAATESSDSTKAKVPAAAD
jgi:putative FmdB family regulatory protein